MSSTREHTNSTDSKYSPDLASIVAADADAVAAAVAYAVAVDDADDVADAVVVDAVAVADAVVVIADDVFADVDEAVDDNDNAVDAFVVSLVVTISTRMTILLLHTMMVMMLPELLESRTVTRWNKTAGFSLTAMASTCKGTDAKVPMERLLSMNY